MDIKIYKISKDAIVAYDELCQTIGKMKTEMENFENECFQKFDFNKPGGNAGSC